jgi:hypothetical protein
MVDLSAALAQHRFQVKVSADSLAGARPLAALYFGRLLLGPVFAIALITIFIGVFAFTSIVTRVL